MSGYGTLPARSGICPLETKWPLSILPYTVPIAERITNRRTGAIDPLVSLSLTASPSGTGELAISALSVDSTGLCVTWLGAGGVPGRKYTLTLVATTVSGAEYEWVYSQLCAPDLAVYPPPPAPNPGPGSPITWAANGTLTAYGAYVALSTLGNWPTSSGDLSPGGFYATSTPAVTYINAVPGFGYVPGDPVFLDQITGGALLAKGAMPFPPTDPHVRKQCYMNGDTLCASLG